MIKKLSNLYNYLPVRLQHLACTLYGYKEKRKRFDSYFKKILISLKASEYWTEDSIREFHISELQKTWNAACENVPYYRDNFPHLFDLKIRSFSDWQSVPILEKKTLREQAEQFISNKWSISHLHKFQTSGTTGTPLTLYKTPEAISTQWAVWSRHKERFGVKYNDKHALFTGKPIVPLSYTRPPFWRYNRAMKQVVFGMLHITPDNIGAIIGELNSGGFQFYSGYPSIIYQVAATARLKGIVIDNGPKVIFTGAEPLYDYQKEVISEVFGCPVTDQYGTTEGAGNASSCTYGKYHEDFEFGFLEVIPDEIGDDPEVGEILMTSFSNHAMPLIRYRVGDRGKWLDEKCLCGRSSRILAGLEGRTEDYVITPEGNKITRFDYIYKGVNGLEAAQVIQRKAGEIDVLLVTNAEFTADEQRKILEAIKRYISPTIEVRIKVVNDIPRTRSGKFRAVINQL